MLAQHVVHARRERIRLAAAVTAAALLGLSAQAPALLQCFQGPFALEEHQTSPSKRYVRAVVSELHAVDSHYKRDWLMREKLHYTLASEAEGAAELRFEMHAEAWRRTQSAAMSAAVDDAAPGSFVLTGWLRPGVPPMLDCTFSAFRFVGSWAAVAFACVYICWRAGWRTQREVDEALAACGAGQPAAAVAAAIEAEAAEEEGVLDEATRDGRVVVTRSWVVLLRTLSPRPVEVVQIGQVSDHSVRFHHEYVGNNVRVEMATVVLLCRAEGGAARRAQPRLTITLPLPQFEAMRASFLSRLTEAQAAIRRQAQHAALRLFRAAVIANGASDGGARDGGARGGARHTPPPPPPECMGCTAAAEVKIAACFCPPAWCCDCLGKWWLASAPPALQLLRDEDEFQRLAGELVSTCPTCRMPFCLRDCVPLPASEVGDG